MQYLLALGGCIGVFLAAPWVSDALDRYYHAVHRILRRRKSWGPECSERHTETGRCEIARNR
ncbi:hypothetical protein GKQ77_01805 [Streptomyces sp. BG9H]|uniref:Uncharacterized protein n=1 Tax=Streptomyces anatolicus TaxID=2675858 RepID=A0ABS6YFW8_9ACTN|nr:hypothetical protein [Streptomyces anatolicus]MBW5420306.1 hypothetical protein [Streptomyces anatolicus]